MSDFDYVRQRLPRHTDKAKLEADAEGSGVPFHTLLKIAKGITEDPRTSTISKLAGYYRLTKRARAA